MSPFDVNVQVVSVHKSLATVGAVKPELALVETLVSVKVAMILEGAVADVALVSDSSCCG